LVIVEQANTTDLLIMSSSEGGKADTRFRHLPEHVLMACGRPGIVIPESSSLESLGDRILIAWDGRKESTRAVFGALPILKKASEVRVLTLWHAMMSKLNWVMPIAAGMK